MFPPDPSPNLNPPNLQQKEVPTNPPRGRTNPQDPISPTQRSREKHEDSRSPSRGRTSRRPGHEHGQRRVNPSPEAFVYPCLGGGFAPKGRPPTVFEAVHLSDAPHLEYKIPANGGKPTSGAVKSPQMSHIRIEVEAAVEMTGACGGAAVAGEVPEENLEKD